MARLRFMQICSRGAYPPELSVLITLFEHRGRREDRVPACTHGPSRAKVARKREATGTGGDTPAFPAQWFYGLYVISPVNLADCHRRLSRSLSASLGLERQPLGRQDHTISPSASVLLVGQHLHVHRIPASRVVTSAIRPSEKARRDTDALRQIRISVNRNIFARRD